MSIFHLSSFPPARRTKVTRACDPCRKRKVRCTGRAVCPRCMERNLNCTFTIGDLRSSRGAKSKRLNPGADGKKIECIDVSRAISDSDGNVTVLPSIEDIFKQLNIELVSFMKDSGQNGLPNMNDIMNALSRAHSKTDSPLSDLLITPPPVSEDHTVGFDHHQREFNETFNSNFQTKLSSAGLIYKHFGKEIIQHVLKLSNNEDIELLYLKVYKEFIEALDANDNGINNYSKEAEENKKFSDKNITLPAIISKLNPSWNTNPTDEDFDKAFETSSKLMGDVFINLLDGYGKSWLPARSIVEDAFNNRLDVDKSGEILVLGQFCPWKEHLYQIEKENDAQGLIKFVLFKDSSDKWRISTVSVTSTSFEFRLGLPEAWRGIRDQELSKLTGVPGCIFVHAAGFIGGANSQESVLELAKKSLAAAK